VNNINITNNAIADSGAGVQGAAQGISFYSGDSSNVVIDNNKIGTNAEGTADKGNAGNGIYIGFASGNFSNFEITNNVISGNGARGAFLIAYYGAFDDLTVTGNKIGTNAAGTAKIPNDLQGLYIGGVTNVTVGGTTVAERNQISGNAQTGLVITTSNGNVTDGVSVLGNYIGTHVGGQFPIANGLHGIDFNGATNVNIGNGTVAGRNIISGNAMDGINALNGSNLSILGNYIGLNHLGTFALSNGTNAGSEGIIINNTSNVDIGDGSVGGRNVISGNVSNGIEILNTSDTSIVGNFVGTNAVGTAAVPNGTYGGTSDLDGIYIWTGVTGGLVQSNVISGNTRAGLVFTGDASGVDVQSNIIGLNANAVGKVANLRGVWLASGNSDITIGDSTLNGNVIAGNTEDGIRVAGASNNISVQGNYIGSNKTNAPNLGNGSNGLLIENASNVNIGDGTAAGKNLIINNGGDGVNITGSAADITMLRNEIKSNAGLGIDLGTDGINTNDADDTDVGANGLLNYPEFTSVQVDGTALTYNFNLDVPAGNYRIEFYRDNVSGDANGEGAEFLGHADIVSAGSAGIEVFSGSITSIASLNVGDNIAATATQILP